METPYPIPPECREWRRFRALYLKRRGWYQRDIAETLDISEVSVSRWLADARDYGPESLRARPSPGAPPRLSPAQRRSIPKFLWHGPEAYGFRGQVWTLARVAKVIEWEFGVRYHKGHDGVSYRCPLRIQAASLYRGPGEGTSARSLLRLLFRLVSLSGQNESATVF
ncbi:MAG: helix-turn-helix domain-containing protein [Isosphaeraceae bacterium]